MPTFFHGWRRKTGVVTLVMACVFMAGWARSRLLVDNPYFPVGPIEVVEILSIDHHIGVLYMKSDMINHIPRGWGWRTIERTREFASIHKYANHWGGWRWYLFGFGSTGVKHWETRQIQVLFLPYWSIILLLNLLSAWLLLSKPHSPKPSAESQPRFPDTPKPSTTFCDSTTFTSTTNS